MSHNLQTVNHMHVGIRVPEEENVPNNWKNLDINNLKISHGKNIYLFGGNTTTRPEAANGNAKIIRSLITPDNAKKTNIYSFMYDTEPLKSDGFLRHEYADDIEALIERTFKPMLYDNSGNIKELKGIEQTFSKMVFASHCGGSYFVNSIINEFYNTLLKKYPESTAEQLISKIQYFSYAPMELPEHNINSLYITPFYDSGYSWCKGLKLAENNKIDIDFPRGIMKKIEKAKRQTNIEQLFNSTLSKYRIMMFKVGQETFLIPHHMNPRTHVGDHTIECIAKPQFLNSGTNYEETARICNFASKLHMNKFLSGNVIDNKKAFSTIADRACESIVSESESSS